MELKQWASQSFPVKKSEPVGAIAAIVRVSQPDRMVEGKMIINRDQPSKWPVENGEHDAPLGQSYLSYGFFWVSE